MIHTIYSENVFSYTDTITFSLLMISQVLEACVKNCGYRFHVLVSAREFVEGVLVRTILPRNDPPLVVHDRILTIIQVRISTVRHWFEW